MNYRIIVNFPFTAYNKFLPVVYNELCKFCFNAFCFRRSVLEQHKADGLDRVGPVKWSLALCVLAVFLLVYFSLWKGVRSTGKVSLL
jgi:hypothetical protein